MLLLIPCSACRTVTLLLLRLSLLQINRSHRLQILLPEIVLVGHTTRNGSAHLPYLVQHRRVVRHPHCGEDPHQPIRELGLEIRDLDRDGGLLDRAIGLDVECLDGHRTVGLMEGNKGLGPNHAFRGGVDGPGDPAVGIGWGGLEGEGKEGIRGVVGPVEGGIELGEIVAGLKDSVF